MKVMSYFIMFGINDLGAIFMGMSMYTKSDEGYFLGIVKKRFSATF